MAKTAVSQLQEQIEAIRREAFADGFAAAMQSVREFAAKQLSGADPDAAGPQGRRQPEAGSRRARRRPSGEARPQRGTNARLVEEILQSNAPRALRPAEIRTAIQREKGVALAFTSIRHALGQLESRDVAEQVADSKTWRYREQADGAAVSAG